MTRKHLAVVLKATVSIALIWWLVAQVELAPILARLASFGPLDILVPLGTFVLMTASAAQRWRMVAGAIGSPLPFPMAFRFYWIGTFFNQTLPSAIGGDAVRVWLVSRIGLSFGRSFSIVVCERVVGLLALILIIAAGLPLLWRLVPDPAARISLTALVAVGIAGSALVVGFGGRLMKPLSRLPFGRSVSHLTGDFRLSIVGPGSGLPMMVLSIFIHICNIAIVWVLAHGLELSVGFFECMAMVPPVVLLTMLPISIAGWGVREGAMVVAFGFVGVAPADAIALSLLHGLVYLVGGLPGGVLWLSDTRRTGLAADSEQDAKGGEIAGSGR